ncbi:MAG: branched-chain amino acid transporter AzlC [Sedimenticola selenatireducens]|uniref:Branched-chain amino acid transporter AzlC n=2 Tax=Sedimenticola selenatireducens TaxID=191960 RepID=A0A2N6CX30_9GAMM|nr:AzlC family ABC transporter permease [Sedimenticola selenatireducens]PLX61847.1 MAG: branched-chain amino acid transporter AzlC [Sedimenticola selenatireducens]
MSNTHRTFCRGFLDCSPFILVVAPFGLLFGVAAAEPGLDLIQTMSMTILVIAGAAQFTALALIDDHTPTFIVILVSLVVNLRMAMYSAALVPHLGKAPLKTRMLASYFMVDQTFAVSIRQYEHTPQWPIKEKLAYYFGAATSICPFWYGFSLLGALIGKAITESYALDFAIPICFISLVAPMLRSLPHLAAALVSITMALLLAWMPYNLWLLVAAVAAMMAGARTELWLKEHQT